MFIVIPLLLVAGGVTYLVCPDRLNVNKSTPDIPGQSETTSQESEEGSPFNVTQGSPKFIVYYFHGTVRCPTCLSIEEYAKEAIKAAFPDKLELGDLEWKPVNTDESVNAHFTTDFNLQFSSLIFAEVVNGKVLRWENKEKIWELVFDKEAFVEYIKSQARKFMGDTE